MRRALVTAALVLAHAVSAAGLTLDLDLPAASRLQGTTFSARVTWRNDGAAPVSVVVAPHAFAYTLAFEVRDAGNAVVPPAAHWEGLGDDGMPESLAPGAERQQTYDVSMLYHLPPGAYTLGVRYRHDGVDLASPVRAFSVIAPGGAEADAFAALRRAIGAAEHRHMVQRADELLASYPTSAYRTPARLLLIDHLLALESWSRVVDQANRLLADGELSPFETTLVERARAEAQTELGGDAGCTSDDQCDDGDACTHDRCGEGRCLSAADGGFEGAICQIHQLAVIQLCSEALPRPLAATLAKLVGRAEMLVGRAQAASKRAVRRRLLAAASRDLAKVVAKARTMVRKRRLSASCKEAIATAVGARRGIVADLRR